jgi:CheY-like chemotaxis protein
MGKTYRGITEGVAAMALGKVLIVDDDKDNLAYLASIVGEAGYSVETLIDGTEAVTRMQAEPPDMVFLDIQMPYINGFQVLKTIRETESLSEIPVVFLSAIGSVTGEDYDPDKIQAQYGVRPDAFMPKTIEPSMVREQLDTFVKSKSA